MKNGMFKQELAKARLEVVHRGCVAAGWDLDLAATTLGMSRSYLYGFIKKEPTLRREWERAKTTIHDSSK